eukprot:TRINITY_DN2743_c0_g1_i2.p1 TRINITY_DN2743_c0_g1~~TRINITY_DN2743_c0_g1_i2.p1  ORF type:complete len:217 (+),score=41.15 TRINITY_DN2743_c0_g1_i2:471-1121(+)
MEAATETQKSGSLSEQEKEFLRTVFQQMEGEDKAIDTSHVSALMCEVNSGIAPKKEDEKLVMEYFESLAPGGKTLDLAMFFRCVQHWYINTRTTILMFPSEVSERRMQAVKATKRCLSTAANQLDTKEKQLVFETFARYDKADEGVIRSEELREMMADLNSGIYPTDQEVQHVMWFADTKQHGFLDVKEFESAVTFWYIHTMEERERAKSHCCNVL